MAQPCLACKGTTVIKVVPTWGEAYEKDCPECSGPDKKLPTVIGPAAKKCDICHGTGEGGFGKCMWCGGTGIEKPTMDCLDKNGVCKCGCGFGTKVGQQMEHNFARDMACTRCNLDGLKATNPSWKGLFEESSCVHPTEAACIARMSEHVLLLTKHKMDLEERLGGVEGRLQLLEEATVLPSFELFTQHFQKLVNEDKGALIVLANAFWKASAKTTVDDAYKSYQESNKVTISSMSQMFQKPGLPLQSQSNLKWMKVPPVYLDHIVNTFGEKDYGVCAVCNGAMNGSNPGCLGHVLQHGTKGAHVQGKLHHHAGCCKPKFTTQGGP